MTKIGVSYLYQIHPLHQVLDLFYDCNLNHQCKNWSTQQQFVSNLFGRVKFVQLHCKRSLDDLRSLLLFLLRRFQV